MPKFFHLITPLEALVALDIEEVFTPKHDQSDWGDNIFRHNDIEYHSLTIRIELLKNAIKKSSIFFDEELKAELEKCEEIRDRILGYYHDHKNRAFITSEIIGEDEQDNLHKIPAEDWFIEGQSPQEILNKLTQDGNDIELNKLKDIINSHLMDKLEPILKRLAKE